MNRPLITIHLTKPEARLCRDAAKAFGPGPLVDAGEQLLGRAEWFEMQLWLTWYSCDFERPLKLDTRHAAERLSKRLESIIDRHDVVNPPEPVATVAAERQKSLAWD